MLERALADWPLKLLALVLAFGIWVAITGEDHTLKDFSIPVELQLREDRIAASPPPTTVTVRLEGPQTAIRKLDPLRLAVRLDLLDSPLGEREVQLSEPHLDGVPQSVRVAFFNPDRLHLVVDRRMRRELEVMPQIVGEPPAGLYVYGALARPRRVEVEGPESVVRDLTELRTDPVPLDQRTRSFVVLVGTVAHGNQVRPVAPQPLEVQVIIDAAPVERTLADVPVVLDNAPARVLTVPETIDVTISGPPGIVRTIGAAQIRVQADVAGLEPGAPARRVAPSARLVDLPEDVLRRVRVTSTAPAEIAVRLAGEGAS